MPVLTKRESIIMDMLASRQRGMYGLEMINHSDGYLTRGPIWGDLQRLRARRLVDHKIEDGHKTGLKRKRYWVTKRGRKVLKQFFDEHNMVELPQYLPFKFNDPEKVEYLRELESDYRSWMVSTYEGINYLMPRAWNKNMALAMIDMYQKFAAFPKHHYEDRRDEHLVSSASDFCQWILASATVLANNLAHQYGPDLWDQFAAGKNPVVPLMGESDDEEEDG